MEFKRKKMELLPAIRFSRRSLKNSLYNMSFLITQLFKCLVCAVEGVVEIIVALSLGDGLTEISTAVQRRAPRLRETPDQSHSPRSIATGDFDDLLTLFKTDIFLNDTGSFHYILAHQI